MKTTLTLGIALMLCVCLLPNDIYAQQCPDLEMTVLKTSSTDDDETYRIRVRVTCSGATSLLITTSYDYPNPEYPWGETSQSSSIFIRNPAVNVWYTRYIILPKGAELYTALMECRYSGGSCTTCFDGCVVTVDQLASSASTPY